MTVSDTRSRFRWGQPLLIGAVGAIALAGIIAMQRFRLNQPSLWVSNPKQAEEQEAVRLKLLQKAPTFGFDNLLANWVFLNFLQYYGDTPVRQQTGYSLSPLYFDLITRLDPRFVEVYLFLSGTLSYQLGKPELAIQLMNRGTEALSPQINPRAFQVWRLKGIDQLLLLGDTAGSIRSHEMAAEWVKGTPYEKFAPLFQQTADFLRQDPDSIPVRFQAWESVFYQAMAVGDKQTQERARQEIIKLGGRVVEKDGQLTFELTPDRPKP